MSNPDAHFEELTRDYRAAFRAWHEASYDRAAWKGMQFFPLAERDVSLLNDRILAEHQSLLDAEMRAYEVLLSARQALKDALRPGAGEPDTH